VPAERIPIPELKKKLETNKKLVVVDVREPKEIKEGGGGRASRAADSFLKAGYKTVQFCGIRDWKKGGLPTVPGIK